MPTDPNGVLDGDTPPIERSWRGIPRRRLLLAAGGVAVPALAFVLWWFEPQALLFDQAVDEDFPIASADEVDEAPGASGDQSGDDSAASGDIRDGEEEAAEDAVEEAAPDADDDTESAEVEPAPSGPVELGTGSFQSRNRYTVTGNATSYELEDGQRLLRLEDFESTNGPDLFVYLTAADAGDDDAAFDADFVDLGMLTGNIGNQNYVIPTDVDLDRYDTVVIWCRRFTSSFGVADLTP